MIVFAAMSGARELAQDLATCVALASALAFIAWRWWHRRRTPSPCSPARPPADGRVHLPVVR